jgi:uncharacterized protein YceK
MDIIYLIFIIILSGCAWSSFKIGHNEGVRAGAETTIEMLHTNKVISFDNKGNIVPNSYFKA